MRTLFSRIKLGALLCIAAMVATACISDDENHTVTYSSFFTITGDKPNYKLIDDGGVIVYPTMESVNELTSNKGFGDNKRAQFYLTYDDELDKITDDKGVITIKNAKLVGGQYILTAKVLNTEEATNLNILTNDSIFSIQAFNQFWLANGYLTTSIRGQYSSKNGTAIRPTINLFVPNENIKENEVAITVLYNRHSSKNENAAGISDFVNSFDMSSLQIPGNDSVLVSLSVNGANTIKAKVARKAFKL